MKKSLNRVIAATFLVVIAVLALASSGCALKSRGIGMKDPEVEIAKENGATIRALAEAMKAQAEVIAKALEASKATPTPTPTPGGERQ